MKQIDDMYPLFLKLPPENIVLLKCLVESYDGIAEIRTLDADVAIVVLLAMKDTKDILSQIIETENKSLNSAVIPMPEHLLQSDWLFAEMIQEMNSKK